MTMRRRTFFQKFIPLAHGRAPHGPETAQGPEPSEGELFVRAMAMGIDPATLSPGRLRALLSTQTGQRAMAAPPVPDKD